MTVSARASEIYKLIKPSGGKWSDAMRRAYEEIAEQEAQREEAENRAFIQDLVISIRNQNAGSFYEGRTLNNMLGDIVNAVVDLRYDRGIKYPYTSSVEFMKQVGNSFEEIEQLVYSYTNQNDWDSLYRLTDGRISSSWWNDVNNLMDQLGITSEMVDGYEQAQSFFIG